MIENKKLQVAGWLSNQVVMQRAAGKAVEFEGTEYHNIGIANYVQVYNKCFTDMVETLEITDIKEEPGFRNNVQKSFTWEGMQIVALFDKEEE